MAETAEPVILVERRNAVAIVYFNRPDVMNAVNADMVTAFTATLRSLDADSDVRAIVLTGKGRGFCAGADLGLATEGAEAIEQQIVPAVEDMPTFVRRMSTPVVAAVNGAVAGLGLAYMLAADIRFIATEATVSTSFARLGLVAEYGLSWTLPRVVGAGRALDLLLSGRPITGEQALAYGLAEFAVPLVDLFDTAFAYAADLAANCSPTSMAIIKRQIAGDLERGESEAMRETLTLMSAAFRRPDLTEAVAARAERRAPAFGPVTLQQ